MRLMMIESNYTVAGHLPQTRNIAVVDGDSQMMGMLKAIISIEFAVLSGMTLLSCGASAGTSSLLATASPIYKAPPESSQAAPTPTIPPSPELSPAVSPQPSSVTTGGQHPEAPDARWEIREYPVPSGSHPHDVAPAPDGSVWYTAQASGELGRLDPATGKTHHIKLGARSAPHGVILGPDGAPWVTDGGLNAIVRVDPKTEEVRSYPLPPEGAGANLNTAVFDSRGVLWFTGQSGYYGWLDPRSGEMRVIKAPGGPGPYGITVTPDGNVYYASLAGSHIARIDAESSVAIVLKPPTAGQGARRVWSDSKGRVWVSEWNAGQLGMYDPKSGSWREWRLPGTNPHAYAVYVDDQDAVWLSDFGANSLLRFDPGTEGFTSYPLPSPSPDVRQLLGRPGEVWGAESGADRLVVVRRVSR